MNQEKIGRFLKQLRMEKQLTQEKLSETLGVSRRTVSRWETGNNLPDLSILVELADFYDVDLKEIFAGERNQNMMNEEEKDTLKQAAAYTEQRKKKKHAPNAYSVYYWMYFHGVLFFDSVFRTRTVNTII